MGTGYDYQETQCKWRKETGGLSPKAKLTGWKEDKSKKNEVKRTDKTGSNTRKVWQPKSKVKKVF